MDAMMSTVATPSPLVLSLWLIHWVGGALWIMGAVLFAVWAVKHLSPERLRSIGLWIFVVGLLISIVTVSAEAQGVRWLLAEGHGMSSGDANPMQSMMDGVMGGGDDAHAQDHLEHERILQSLRPSAAGGAQPANGAY